MAGAALSIETVIAVAAFLVAGWSALTAHRAYKLAAGASEPVVSAEIEALPLHPGWWKITVIVTNRSEYLSNGETIRVLWPPRARLLSWEDGTEGDAYNNPVIRSHLNSDDGSRVVSMQLKLARSGTAGRSLQSFYGTRDTHSEEFILWQPSGGRLLMRVALSLSDAAKSRKVVTIRRLLKTDKPIAAAIKM